MGEMEQKIKTCMELEPPACQVSCPFDLDIREFITKIQRGAWNGAFRLFVNAVAFPEIVTSLCEHPCEKNCVYAGSGGEIHLHELEKAVFAYARNTDPISYNVPVKPQTIAVIGGGISGLACALRLAQMKYRVVVYEKSHRIGGRLWDILDDEIFLRDIKKQFMHETVEIKTDCEIKDLNSVTADAIYIATGKNGDLFGVSSCSEGAFASDHPGVFLGGELMGSSLMEAINDGLQSVHAIERYLKVGSMNQPKKERHSLLVKDPDTLPKTNPILPDDGLYTKEQAIAESRRCLKCQCDACIKNCTLMGAFQKYPKRIYEEVCITVVPSSLSRDARVATRLVATCNHCGVCESVCPKGINVGKFLLESHRSLREQGAMPWAFHEFWLRDMDFSNTVGALCRPAPSGKKGKYAFFPGCRLGSSDSRYVTKSYGLLCDLLGDVSLMMECCGAPAEWAGDTKLHKSVIDNIRNQWEELDKPTLILACATCMEEFHNNLPEIPLISLYEIMADYNQFCTQSADVTMASVFDPCSSRKNPEMQEAVRVLLSKAPLTLFPLSEEKDKARCCSWGGQISIANPRYAKEVAYKRSIESDYPYIVYCANCRDIFSTQKKSVLHILDLFFFPDAKDRWNRKPPTVTESRENRKKCKVDLLRTFWKEEPIVEATSSFLTISPEMLQKLDREMLLIEDVEKVITHCEQTGRKIYNTARGTFCGHKMVGHFTVWAEYRLIDGKTELCNAYAHRMEISEN